MDRGEQCPQLNGRLSLPLQAAASTSLQQTFGPPAVKSTGVDAPWCSQAFIFLVEKLPKGAQKGPALLCVGKHK